jgi:hypothetical protein
MAGREWMAPGGDGDPTDRATMLVNCRGSGTCAGQGFAYRCICPK